jgi:thymidine phosphorylase
MLAPEIIRAKRDGHRLSDAQIQAFVQGLVSAPAQGGWSEGQAAALAMAIVLRGMDSAETLALTLAMADSGSRLSWAGTGLAGPVLDKHSTGGVGDKVSLILAPLVAACGAVVPMVSGRGLAHTGGTLDKLEALPGYLATPSHARLLDALRKAGCAIVGASEALAPADRRLYAIRDVTATVDSLPLITASIVSKKLAAGLQGLVLDIKAGSGAFMPDVPAARELARSLVQVAQAAGLPARALITDMNQVLGDSAGNALEVREALDFLTGERREARLEAVTLALAAELLHLGGLAPSVAAARARAERALASGAAAERFARMVAALGGPPDVLRDAGLVPAPVCLTVPAPCDGVLARMDVRALGLAVLNLGAGRSHPGAAIDHRVGLDHVLPLGHRVRAGDRLARVHAVSVDAAQQAVRAVQAACVFEEEGRRSEVEAVFTAAVVETVGG